jgi:sugar phosphate isomerase/epimerase
MPISPALQLYTVRDQLNADFAGTIRKVASYGYKLVETAGFPHTTPQAAKALFDELGLNVVSAHSKLPLGDDKNEILETLAIVSSPYLICPWLDPNTYFSSVDGIKAACEMLNQANAVLLSAGLKLAYHNHWFEAEIVDGKPAYQHMLDYLEPSIDFELDTYWLKVGGLDPVEVIKGMGTRAALLHLKDGPADGREAAMTALGQGAMDIPAILAVSQAEAHIVELDRCDTDMLTAVQASYDYLKGLDS